LDNISDYTSQTIGSGISLNPYILYKYKNFFLQLVVAFLYCQPQVSLVDI
jgi:hypothetical protein